MARLSPDERLRRAEITGRIGAHESWARTADRSARTAPGRAAAMARFEKQVDPDGVLTSAERAVRAEHALKAHMQRLALRRWKKAS